MKIVFLFFCHFRAKYHFIFFYAYTNIVLYKKKFKKQKTQQKFTTHFFFQSLSSKLDTSKGATLSFCSILVGPLCLCLLLGHLRPRQFLLQLLIVLPIVADDDGVGVAFFLHCISGCKWSDRLQFGLLIILKLISDSLFSMLSRCIDPVFCWNDKKKKSIINLAGKCIQSKPQNGRRDYLVHQIDSHYVKEVKQCSFYLYLVYNLQIINMIWSNKAIESKVKINVILFIYHQTVMVFDTKQKFKTIFVRKNLGKK